MSLTTGSGTQWPAKDWFLQVFLQTQKEFLGEERVSQFHTRFLIELGRINYLKITPSDPLISVNKVRQPYRVKQRLNKRFLLLHISPLVLSRTKNY